MDKDTLREIELQIFQMIIDFTHYAGTAFLQDDEEMMNIFKGQHTGLMRLQKWVSEKYLRACQKEDKEKEGKSFAEHVKEQMATLKDFDHRLFRNVVWGLMAEGWKHKGGSETYALLNKDDAAIKVFRDTESPQVIKICFSAEPEESKVDEKEELLPQQIEFTEDAIKKYLDSCIDFWRGQKTAEALIYIDAYQSVRVSLFGKLKPKGKNEKAGTENTL